MAKGFKHAGGAGLLNFRVVGGLTPPENPRENTLWITTDVAITGWQISQAAPDTPAEGMVWIESGTGAEASFNALNKQALWVCPRYARQYVSGNWVTRGAQSYRDGAWIAWWDGYLYNQGNQCTPVTGGWSPAGYQFWTYGCNASLKSGYISLALVSGQASGGVGTVNKVDLSGHTLLKATVNPEGNDLYVCVLNTKSTDMHGSVPAHAIATGSSSQTVSIDIKKFSSGYIGFGTSGTAKIYAVWLE